MTDQNHSPAVSEAMREAVARDPRVDTQVWTAAASLSPEQIQQPEWLWFANDGTEGIPIARYSFGRWPKIGSAAPYVRADIPLSGPIASEIARLTEERDAANTACDMAAMSGGFYAKHAETYLARAKAAEAELAKVASVVRSAAMGEWTDNYEAMVEEACAFEARMNAAEAALSRLQADRDAEVGKLRAALEFYADDKTWSGYSDEPWRRQFESQGRDGHGFDVARAALTESTDASR